MRLRGAAVGVLVGALAVVASIGALFVAKTGDPARADALLGIELTTFLAVFLALPAATISGWIVAPVAWRARGFGQWLAVVLLLDVVSVAAGLLLFVGVLAIPSVLHGQVGTALLASALLLFGGLLFSVFAVPVALLPAAVWAGFMLAIRNRAERVVDPVSTSTPVK